MILKVDIKPKVIAKNYWTGYIYTVDTSKITPVPHRQRLSGSLESIMIEVQCINDSQ